MKTTNRQIVVNEGGEALALHSATLGGETVPQKILLAPWGNVESSNGSFVVDEESAQLAVQAFDEHGTDLPIDYEHQTLGGVYASPSGQAPAAGWIKRIFAESGVGLLAEIEWTDQAKQRLADKEYRYLSPVAIIRKTDRKLVAIHSAALTNRRKVRPAHPTLHHGSRLRRSIDRLTMTTARGGPQEQRADHQAHQGAGHSERADCEEDGVRTSSNNNEWRPISDGHRDLQVRHS